MGRPGIQMWSWTLGVLFCWLCVGRVASDTGPQYMVAIPAILESGTETTFCADLMHPNETLVMTITLMSQEANTTLLKQMSSTDFHTCTQFTVPSVENEEIQHFEVEVQGNTFYSREVVKVMIKYYHPMSFIQTDKPLYLPGQTVNFRVVTLDTKFIPADQVYDVIEIEDAQHNRIGQWLNQTSNGKILQLSYDLSSEASQGMYKISVTTALDKVDYNFKVEKYVLPKFDVKINAPKEANINQENIEAEVCATYTYGQPVPGSVRVEMCRPLNKYISRSSFVTSDNPEGIPDIAAPCYKETKETDKMGCASFTLPMSTFTKLPNKAVQDSLEFEAKVEEEGTGTVLSSMTIMGISYVTGTLSFTDTPKLYDKEHDVEGRVKAVFYNDTAIADMPVYLFEGERFTARLVQNLTTDSEGFANFTLSTADFKQEMHFQVSDSPTLEYAGYRMAHYDGGHHTMSMIQSADSRFKTVSSLEVQKKDSEIHCDEEEEITISYSIVGEAKGSMELMYLVLSRGAIFLEGIQHVDIDEEAVTEGEVSFKLTVTPDMAPEVQIVAYGILPSEAVVAHSANFPSEKCFSHKVSLEFSPTSTIPGGETTMQMTAQPDSLCGVTIVDQSVLVKEKGKTLNADKIFDLLPVTKVSDIPYQVQDSVECKHIREKRYIVPYPDNDRDDAYTVFEHVGLKMATNMAIRVPSCLRYKGKEYHQGQHIGYRYQSGGGARMASPVAEGYYPSPQITVESVRTFFPETWLWDLVEVGESGATDVSLDVPDTITTWETEAFCLSPQGFGLAPRKEFTVFQPFFLELSLPYSIVRGEDFELKATVFNYLDSCIMVNVIPAASSDYTLTPLSGDLYTSCMCANDRLTLSWTMTPTALGNVEVTVTAEAVPSQIGCGNEIVTVPESGRVDEVKRTLIVKPEGVEKTETHNFLICPDGENVTEEAFVINFPEDVINGSARTSVSAMGDPLGRALNNVDGLLQLPYGCGEQNMARLAPNIYILQYLESTEQLTPSTREKATNFMIGGYQRQLNYIHSNGAYSTFGIGMGNTWLTAFVLSSFTAAQSYIFIDPANIELSSAWLKSKQRDNGCFERSGNLFNNRMKGGVSDEVTLTAYIAAAFLEMNTSVDDPMMKESLSCLNESISDLNNTYTKALLAYVFTLAGEMEIRADLLNDLDNVAIDEGSSLHWSQKATETSPALSVEISSYVLLAKLGADPTAEEMADASRIFRWLTGQQNYYGGFSSTQDTVVGLKALTRYSSLVYHSEGSSSVRVQTPDEQVAFEVTEDNKMLYQEEWVSAASGNYSIEVNGTACTGVQIALHYNIPTPVEVSSLSVKVKTDANCNIKTTKLTLKMKTLYSGKETSTNMVIMDIEMLSGFSPVPESLKKLKGALLVDRLEEKDGHILVYIQELIRDIPINYSLDFKQNLAVHNLQPAVVKIYDYYQPSDHAEAEYKYPCVEA